MNNIEKLNALCKTEAGLPTSYLGDKVPTFLNGIPIKNDEPFAARCSVCFEDKKNCLPVSYPNIIEFYKRFKITPVAYAVCQSCFNTKDKKSLFYNLMDYFVTHEIWRWIEGTKDGIVRNEHEFRDLLNAAVDQGVLYREEKRIRQYRFKHDRVAQKGYVDFLMKQSISDDYKPNALYQSLFKKLYEQE